MATESNDRNGIFCPSPETRQALDDAQKGYGLSKTTIADILASITDKEAATGPVARLYYRKSDDKEDLSRQTSIIHNARTAGYFVAVVYYESAQDHIDERAELKRLISDIQPKDLIIIEKIDCLHVLPTEYLEKLLATIQERDARLSTPEISKLLPSD